MRLVQRLQVQTGKGVEMLPPCEYVARAAELESGRSAQTRQEGGNPGAPEQVLKNSLCDQKMNGCFFSA